MDNKDTKPKKVKKSGLEIRFTVNDSDGNLKEMLDKVPDGCYTDFTKTALRYYLKAVRDREIECDFLKPNALDEFKVQLKQQEPKLEDIIRVIQACSGSRADVGAVAPVSVETQEKKSPVVSEQQDINDDINNDIEEDIDYNIEINIDEDKNENDGTVSETSTQLNNTTFNF